MCSTSAGPISMKFFLLKVIMRNPSSLAFVLWSKWYVTGLQAWNTGAKCSVSIQQAQSCLYSFCFRMADCTSLFLTFGVYKLHLMRCCMNIYPKMSCNTDNSLRKVKHEIYNSLNQVTASTMNAVTSKRKVYFS